MKKGGVVLWIVIVFALILLLGLFAISSHKKSQTQTQTNSQNLPSRDYTSVQKGVGFVTKNDLATDLKTASTVGLVFFNAASTNGEIPSIIKTGFDSGYVQYPVPNMASSGDSFENLNKSYYDLVTKYHPYYIGIGNEIERMSDPEAFVSVYNKLYDSVKHLCGNCMVYPVFQYENFNSTLADEMKMDLLVFTSYPFSKYSDLNKIPSDYYAAAKAEAAKKNIPLAFTEIGWPDTPDFASGASDPQVAFYQKFQTLTSGMNVKFVGWGLLYGVPSAGQEWADMGLLNSDGSKKNLFNVFTA